MAGSVRDDGEVPIYATGYPDLMLRDDMQACTHKFWTSRDMMASISAASIDSQEKAICALPPPGGWVDPL